MDENVDGYWYIFEFENGIAQALGLATFEYIDKNILIKKKLDR